MKRKLLSTVLAVTMAVSRLTGCGQSGTNEATGTGAATTDARTETYRVRIPIDSCDFSLAHYEADGEEADENFEHFSFERVEKYILPLLDAAEKAYGGKLDILLSPWSLPVYMKTNGERNNGGKLKPEYRKRWAEYICRYIEEYRSRGHLWHFTHFLKAGAQRIGVTRYTDKIEMTAFEKDGRITVVLLNRTEEEIPVYLRLGEYCAELTSKAKSIMTAEIEK